MALSVIGVIVALAALAFLCMKGVNVFVTAIASAVIVAIFSNMGVYDTLMGTYAPGFGGFLGSYLFLFMFGSVFGKLMDVTGAARSVAHSLLKLFGRQGDRAVVALILAVGALAYGGVNGFVSIFATFPIMMEVFKETNMPRRFIPALFLFGAGTWANAGPGSPQMLNIICTKSVGLSPMAGAVPGFIGSAVVLVVGTLWLQWMIRRAVNNGEHFVSIEAPDAATEDEKAMPRPVTSFLPLLIVILAVNIRVDGANLFPVETGMFIGCVSIVILNFKHITWNKFLADLGEGCQSAITMVASVCAMVGFGSVVSASPAFDAIVEAVTNAPGHPLVTLAISMNVMCAITATASGASGIIAPILGPLFVSQGIDPNAVARVMAISATGFDSVPHNGTIVVIIHSICKETHQTAYKPVFATCVITPLIGTVFAIIASLIIY